MTRTPKELAAMKARLLKHAKKSAGGCWLWIGSLNDSGYGNFRFENKTAKAHRVSWIVFRGPIVNGLWVLHACDTPACINPNHLFLGTALDNKLDSVKKGRHSTARGSKCHRAVLRECDIPKIRTLLRNGKSSQVVAGKFGVSKSAIRHVKHGRTWAHIGVGTARVLREIEAVSV